MNAKDRIRVRIQRLYESDPVIHLNVSITRPKIVLKNKTARITGIYPHIFQIEANGERFSIQYAEVLAKNVIITELET